MIKSNKSDMFKEYGDPSSYVMIQFREAFETITLGESDMRDRLKIVYLAHFIKFQEKDFIPKHQKIFSKFQQWITRFGPITLSNGRIYKGSVENTLSKVKNKTAAQWVKVLLNMYRDMKDMFEINNSKK